MLSIFSNSDKLLIPPNSIEGKEGMLLLLLIATRLGILTKKPFTVRVRKIELAETKILSMLQVHILNLKSLKFLERKKTHFREH